MSCSTKPYWINKSSPLFVIEHIPKTIKVNKTGIIILNAGFLHNIGPYRLNVDLANYLSSFGFVVSRLDQSSKGDSPTRHDLVGLDAKLADFDETYQELQNNYGVTNCILIGLCSGADDGLEIAEQRESVSGLVFQDGFCPVTVWYYIYHYYIRLRYFKSWQHWKKSIQIQQSGNSKFNKKNSEYTSGMSLRRWASEGKVKVMYKNVLKRGVKSMAIFSGDTGDYYNHRGQLSKALKLYSAQLHEVYFHDADHIYTQPEYRDQLVKSIGAWVKKEFLQK